LGQVPVTKRSARNFPAASLYSCSMVCSTSCPALSKVLKMPCKHRTQTVCVSACRTAYAPLLCCVIAHVLMQLKESYKAVQYCLDSTSCSALSSVEDALQGQMQQSVHLCCACVIALVLMQPNASRKALSSFV